MNLKAASRAATEAAAQIDVRIKTKLLKHVLKHGMTEAQGIDLAETWKRAARHTKHLRLGAPRKGH